MATKKLPKTITPERVKTDRTVVIRWFITGVAAAFILDWFCRGGFYEHTDMECIVILFTIGIAYGAWAEHWLQKQK